MTWLAGIGSKLGAYLAAAGGVIVLLLGVYFKGRKDKHNEIQAKTAETIIKTVKKVKKNEEDIRNMSDDDKRDFLRK